jgi:hypothetical protein
VARALLILALMWLVALAGFLALRQTPKTSPLWGVRDFFWLLLLALSVVSLLAIVGLVTGLIQLQTSPFGTPGY